MTPTTVEAPYVVAYSEETVSLNLAVVRDVWALAGRRLAYSDPRASDWDLGVLWARQETHRGGMVRYDEMHTLRQKECMLGRLCQVCREPAMDARTGSLTWVFHAEPPAATGRLSKPPVCLGCLPGAIAACPQLRREAHVYTSADYDVWGVKGILFSPREGPVRKDVPLTDIYALEWTLARALVVHVRDLQPAPHP
ncbi:hypothetical protein ACQP2T_63665 (plasmid) [Nonomuraea sp. CA-143628]|uniref:hypothetical protein n=1 Tax=Nonomuraea sp. CA-143628 TaxID=3239997 RepID=UPI003D941A1B